MLPNRKARRSGSAPRRALADAEHDFALAVALHQSGKLDEAVAQYRRAIALNPAHASAHHNLGLSLQDQGRLEEARASYARALALDPGYAEAHNCLGTALQALGRLDEAMESYRRALNLNPDYANAHNNVGTVHQAQGRLDEAVESYRRALALQPDYARAHSNLGVALETLGRFDEAMESYRRTLALDPGYADAHRNLGAMLQTQGLLKEAIKSYRRAIELKPDFAWAHANLGMALLLMEDFAAGAAEYEWRWRMTADAVPPSLEQPLWDGRPVPGGTILLRTEQGAGDAIQFVRYAPLVRARCGRVLLQCRPDLAPLFSTAPGVDQIIADDEPLAAFDAHAPLVSLMHILETRLETIPAAVPYLAADPARVAKLLEWTGEMAGVKVGLVWAGNPAFKGDRDRSLASLSLLEPLLGVQGVTFLSLQKGERAGDIAALGLSERIVDLAPALNDFADTAAAISQLDLVISTCTSVPHLAGALGKPVWTMLSYVADWRWLVGREDSPWYPSMRLFRQPTRGDWISVVARVADELRHFARQGAGPRRAAELTGDRAEPRTTASGVGRTLRDEDVFIEAQWHHRQGRLAEAEAIYRRILVAKPDHVGALHYLGVAACQRGDYDAAEEFIGRAIDLAPNYADAHNSLGNVLKAKSQVDRARSSYERALALRPDNAEAHSNLGGVLKEQGQLDEAVASFERALALRPDNAEAQNNLGVVLKEQGKLDEAVARFERALALNPNYAEAHSNFGATFQAQGKLEEALASYRHAIALKPDYAEAHSNLGAALQALGRHDEAIKNYKRAVELNPDSAAAHQNLGLALLKLGDFATGAAEYEWRWRVEGGARLPDLEQSLWDGRPLPGGTILLRTEQGMGDAIQFVRYARLVRQRCSRVLLHCPPSLAWLFTTAPGVDDVIGGHGPLPAFDAHAPLLSLMRIMGTRLETVPPVVPYLAADTTRMARLRARMVNAAGVKVGLAWAGNPAYPKDRNRSLALSALEPLLVAEGATFFSLQKGERESEIAQVGLSGRIIDLAPALNDFADTAAAISLLDLVISVDTAVAHLAGALGKPVWTLVPFASDWRWLVAREDSPWYPTMRLFRQPAHGDWTSVIARVAEELRQLAANRERGEPAQQGADAASPFAALSGDLAAADRAFAEAVAMHQSGKLDEAAGCYRRVIALNPAHASAHNNLGAALQQQGKLDEAAECYARAVGAKPDYAEAHSNLGAALQARGKLDEAIESYERAVALRPDNAVAHGNLGAALQVLGRLDEALASYHRALVIAPDNAEVHSNLGAALQALGRIDEALESYRFAIALKPDHARAHRNLGMTLLLRGDFAAGAFEYEWRWRPGGGTHLPHLEQPLWDGRALPDSTILLRVERGLGDAIQFVRYAPLVRARCGRVLLQCPSSLAPLFATAAGVDRVISEGEPLPAFDAHAPLLSLMRVLGTRLETIPAAVPYLAAEPARVAALRERLGEAVGLKIGLAWADSPDHKNDPNRSLALSALAPLLGEGRATFFSLQKGVWTGEIGALGLSERIVDLAPALYDFADTAAAISQLDLVISVDTAAAHLAGALGKPVWTLVPFAPDWRWLVGREDSPWYPSMRLFRQPARGDWPSVIARVAEELRYRAQHGAACAAGAR